MPITDEELKKKIQSEVKRLQQEIAENRAPSVDDLTTLLFDRWQEFRRRTLSAKVREA